MTTVRLFRSDGMQERYPEGANHSDRGLGPFEWVQLTYEELRAAPDGDRIAFFDGVQGAWITADGARWSDIVISAGQS